MAKKFVRGITDIKTISNQDFDTNNVNDLLSDGEHNYIHRKKGKTEEYHNLTNNLKTIASDNTDLLNVTNNNNSTNSATLHPKHDSQKEQVIESTRNTITIQHAENATSETTKVDTNPAIVLEHEKLLTDYGLSKTTSNNTSTLAITVTPISDGYDLNTLISGHVIGTNLLNAPSSDTYIITALGTQGGSRLQTAVKGLSNLTTPNSLYIRERIIGGDWTDWREQVGDKSVIDNLLNQKQNTINTGVSIGTTSNNSLRQLYALKQTYSVTGAVLKTHVKSVSENTSINTPEEEFNFIVKLNKGVSSVNFTLNTHDTTKFSNIMAAYGENNTVRISGCVFTLSDRTLTVTTANNTEQNYVITFSDII